MKKDQEEKVTTSVENIKDYYHFVRYLGQGGFSTVRVAQKKDTGKLYAVKSIAKDRVKYN